MKPNVLALTAAGVLFGLAGPTLAQSNTEQGFTHGESKRCESMTGAAKEQCDKQEGAKTEDAAPGTAASGSERSATG